MHRFFWLRFLLTLLLAGALIAGGVLLYNTGYSNGYNAAAIIAQNHGQLNATPQVPYYGYGPFAYGFGFPFFFPFFPLVGIAGFFLFFFLVGSVFRLWGWRRWNGHPGWQRWGYEHGQNPPTGSGEQPDSKTENRDQPERRP